MRNCTVSGGHEIMQENYKLYEENQILQAELARLREENKRLKTQLSGITQHGSVDAAELQRLREGNVELNRLLCDMFNCAERDLNNNPHGDIAYMSYIDWKEFDDRHDNIEALAKHKNAGGAE